MPNAGFPLVNDLPTNDVSQSAPIDGVLPVNVCSIVVAVDGTASNQCEPTHLSTTPTGSVPVNVPVTVCAVTAALDGTADGTCTGASTGTTLPIGTPGSPGTGHHAPDHDLRHRGGARRYRQRLLPDAHGDHVALRRHRPPPHRPQCR